MTHSSTQIRCTFIGNLRMVPLPQKVNDKSSWNKLCSIAQNSPDLILMELVMTNQDKASWSRWSVHLQKLSQTPPQQCCSRWPVPTPPVAPVSPLYTCPSLASQWRDRQKKIPTTSTRSINQSLNHQPHSSHLETNGHFGNVWIKRDLCSPPSAGPLLGLPDQSHRPPESTDTQVLPGWSTRTTLDQIHWSCSVILVLGQAVGLMWASALQESGLSEDVLYVWLKWFLNLKRDAIETSAWGRLDGSADYVDYALRGRDYYVLVG